MLNFLKLIFTGPSLPPPDSFRATFHMTSGAAIMTNNVKLVKVTKTAEGGVASYRIEWHDGLAPEMFTLMLDHISAIVVTKES